MKLENLYTFFDLRKTLLVVAVMLAFFALNSRWQAVLNQNLFAKREELSESLSLLDSGALIQEKKKEVENLQTIKSSQAQFNNWTDRLAPLVAEQKMILRQVRPLGVEVHDKIKEEKLFLQVEGSVDGLIGLLHYLASQETPIYVSHYSIASRSIGSGFISVELVLARIIL